MKKLIFSTIEKFIKGVDTYNNNGSVWLIFTDEKKWVIELTKEGTLWYNYYFFQDIFKYFSLDVVENQRYITEWFELFIQNGVKETFLVEGTRIGIVENTIQNGVKETKHNTFEDGLAMEEAIQNGVKHTEYGDWLDGDERFDDIIKNGVKETWGYEKQSQMIVNEVINKGEKTIYQS